MNLLAINFYMSYNIPFKFLKFNNDYIYVSLNQPVIGNISPGDITLYYFKFAVLMQEPNTYYFYYAAINKNGDIDFIAMDQQALLQNNLNSYTAGNVTLYYSEMQPNIKKNITINIDFSNKEINYIKDKTINKIYTIKQLKSDTLALGTIYKMPIIENHSYLFY